MKQFEIWAGMPRQLVCTLSASDEAMALLGYGLMRKDPKMPTHNVDAVEVKPFGQTKGAETVKTKNHRAELEKLEEKEKVQRLEAQLSQARQTNAKLHRRVQQAESFALIPQVKQIQQILIHEYVFWKDLWLEESNKNDELKSELHELQKKFTKTEDNHHKNDEELAYARILIKELAVALRNSTTAIPKELFKTREENMELVNRANLAINPPGR